MDLACIRNKKTQDHGRVCPIRIQPARQWQQPPDHDRTSCLPWKSAGRARFPVNGKAGPPIQDGQLLGPSPACAGDFTQTRALLVTGRIRRKKIQAQLEAMITPDPRDPICPLCLRPIPPTQQDAHHLVPQSQGGKQTVVLHRICHRQVHALLTETELARHYNTVDALKTQSEVARFLKWVQTKPDAFFEKSRKSHRLKNR